MKIEFEISDDQIDRLLDHAAYDWLDLRNSTGDWKEDNLRVKFDRPGDEEGTMRGRKVIGRAAVAKGVRVMMKEEPWIFRAWMEEDDDMDTCDAAYQLIIFGKLVYA